MAKKPKLNMNLLAAIADATKKNEIFYVSHEDGLPLVKEGLIEVNVEDIQDGKAASRATPKGIEMSAKDNNKSNSQTEAAPSAFAIIGGIELPKSKRGGGAGGGAPSKYPFDQLEVGASFFVNSTTKQPEPWKSMQSSVAAANHKFSEGTGEFETVERTKRGKGNKAELDAAGNKIKETKQVEKRKPIRKFVIRQIEAGKTYGTWTAPENGAVIQRTM